MITLLKRLLGLSRATSTASPNGATDGRVEVGMSQNYGLTRGAKPYEAPSSIGLIE